MSEKRCVKTLLFIVVVLSFSSTLVRAADILFIARMEEMYMPGDDKIKAYVESLGHTVTYFNDSASEAETEEAAAAADAVLISESVDSKAISHEIPEIETPMVIIECWGWDEMGLTLGAGQSQAVVSTDLEIVAPEHFLAAGFSGTTTVLTGLVTWRGDARFSDGIAGDEATVIARATLVDGVTYDVIYVYEKGAALPRAPADGSPAVAADMRVCFGLDEQSYAAWNENAFALLGAAITYALGGSSEAYSPIPADGAVDVPHDVVLRWNPGMNVDKHNVYFGTDANDVNEASIANSSGVEDSQNQEENTYDPNGLLEYGQTYYWRVDEVNEAEPDSPWKGHVWSFTALNFFVVDDFESYDANDNQIWYTWKDGFGYGVPGTAGYYAGNGTGSAVGDENSPTYMETVIIHGGNQSCPFMYSNTAAPFYSEIIREWEAAQDWTADDVVTLTLFFYGNMMNPAEPLYVAVEDIANKIKVVTHPDSAAVQVQVEGWQQWNIPLSEFDAAGVDLAAVKKMYIGVGNRAAPQMGGMGSLYFDDIRLYRTAP